MEISRLTIISDSVSKVTQVYNSFWKWCAMTLALIATFTSIFARIKYIIIRLRTIKPSSSSKHLLHLLDDSFDFTDDNDSDTSSADQQSDNDEDSIFDTTSLFDNQTTNNFSDRDFRVAGSNIFPSDLFSWSDFTAGTNVVKLWENIGLGSDLQDSFLNEYSTWGFEKDCKGSCFPGGKRRLLSSPAVMHLAEKNNSNDGVSFHVYDTRMGGKNPAVYAEWAQSMGKVVGVGGGGGGVEKVYVKGGGAGAAASLTIGDLRNARTPLERLTEVDVGTWWDVINHAEF